MDKFTAFLGFSGWIAAYVINLCWMRTMQKMNRDWYETCIGQNDSQKETIKAWANDLARQYRREEERDEYDAEL